MTEHEEAPMEDKKSKSKEWIDETEQALDRTVDALKAAWDSSRDARLSALESAKEAAAALGAAIDRGVTGARERWDAAQESAAEEAPTEEAGEEE